MQHTRLYHLSEAPAIEKFHPRPSPSYYPDIHTDVVYAISGAMMHNYFLPRDCPRVTFYANETTTKADAEKYLISGARYVVAIESNWVVRAQTTPLYRYEFESRNFKLLDECAGYYISYQTEIPIDIIRIANPFDQLLNDPALEIRILPELTHLAESIRKSSMSFSLIRMKHAISTKL
jgi:hypothetical protein